MFKGFGKLPFVLADSLEKVKGSLLETMARRMSPKDAMAMAQHWAHLMEKSSDAPKASDNQASNKSVHVPDSQTKPPDAKAVTLPQKQWTIPSDVKDEILYHPVFGRKLSNLGYKQVFLANVDSLARAAVWEKQRILRPERALRIANYKVQTGTQKSFLGVITMFMDKTTGKAAILDGQHRAAAYMLLAQQGHINGQERQIMVDVFETNSDQEVAALFKEINSAEPVLLVDMPGGEGASVEVREILDSAADALMSRYPDMFKPSMKCKPPHLNADKFRDSVYESEILNRRNIRTTEELIAYIDKVNEKYSQRSEQEWREIVLKNGLFKTNGKMAEQAISKAQKYGFFLGLDASWMHEA